MSRGSGVVERKIIDALTAARSDERPALWFGLNYFMSPGATEAVKVSTRRSAARLAEKGLIEKTQAGINFTPQPAFADFNHIRGYWNHKVTLVRLPLTDSEQATHDAICATYQRMLAAVRFWYSSPGVQRRALRAAVAVPEHTAFQDALKWLYWWPRSGDPSGVELGFFWDRSGLPVAMELLPGGIEIASTRTLYRR